MNTNPLLPAANEWLLGALVGNTALLIAKTRSRESCFINKRGFFCWLIKKLKKNTLETWLQLKNV